MGIGTGAAERRPPARLSARLLDAVGEAVVAIDPAGSVTYANVAAEYLYGWEPRQLPTRRVLAALVPEDSATTVRGVMDQVRGGEEWTGALDLQRNGVRFRVQATATPVMADGMLTDILVVASDVSEQERREARLADSEASLREAQRVAHVGHWRWDVGSDRVQWLADEVYAIHGVGRDWDGSIDAYLALVPPEDHTSVRAASEQVLRTGAADVVHRIVRPDGVVRHVRNRSEAVYAADGTPVLVLGTCQDVTDQAMLSTALHERVKELTCLVAVGQVLRDLDDPSGVYACVVAALVLAVQHPDRALATIDIDGEVHSSATTHGTQEVTHLVGAPVVIRGRERGWIHLGYTDGDDVLPEELALLEAVASMVALWLERRESALALAEAESRFRRLLHNVPDVVFRLRLDAEGGFDYVSSAVEAMTGYPAEEFLADPQLVLQVLGPSFDAGEASSNATTGADGASSGVAEVTARDGRQHWIEYNLVRIAGDDGAVSAVEGVARDVTDRVTAADAALKRAHEQSVLARISEAAVTAAGLDELFATATRLVVETLPVQASSVTELTTDGKELLLRNGFGWPAEILGVAKFEVAGSFGEATLASDIPTVLVDLTTEGSVRAPLLAAHGLVSGVAVRIAGKEGTFGTLGAFSVAVRAYSPHHIAFLQTVAHILGAAVDRWKAEAALASRERQFRTLTESLPDVVGRIGRDHRHLYVNPAVESLGVTPADLIGKTLREAGLPTHLAELMERAADGVFESGHETPVEFDLPGPDGDLCLHCLLIPEFDDDGHVVTVVGLTRDITGLRRAEETRREGLARIVAAQEAERARIGEDIHDDSIQVMTAVGMRLEGLKRRIDDPEAMAALCCLEDVVRLCVSRLRALMFELRPPQLDREGLAPALRLYLQATFGDDSLTCGVVDAWPSDLPVDARNVLYRIALEAITNTRKHAEASSVEVLIDAENGGVRMRVRDDGTGFDLASLADVGPHHMGTTTMRGRAEAAGGTLDIQSSRGAGTVVTAWLPADAQLQSGDA